MSLRQPKSARNSRGQSLVETAIMLPLLVLMVLNVVNLGYFFLVIVNLTGAARSATLFSSQGASTPFAGAIPSSGGSAPTTATNSVAYLVYQDLTGALGNPTTVTVQVCSQANIDNTGAGVNTNNGDGTASTVQRTNCQTCDSVNGCTPANNSAASTSYNGSPLPDVDPEAPSTNCKATNHCGPFVLNQVQIKYVFKTLIPGKIFNIPLQASAMCNGGTCTFYRMAEMRAMN